MVAAAPADSVQLTAPVYVVTENGTAAVVVVSRTGSTAGTVTVAYATSDGSATAGTDYTAQSGTLTFNDGEVSKTITIPIQDDNIANGDRSFHIALANPAGATLGSVAQAQVTIADDDGAGQINFATSASTCFESFGTPPLVVTRSGGTHGRVTVDYRVTGGTARVHIPSTVFPVNEDYLDFYGTLTFEDGQTTAKIPVDIYDDYFSALTNPAGPVHDGPRTIEVTLGNPTGGATLGAVPQTVLTVTDEDDIAGGFAISVPTNADGQTHPFEVVEGNFVEIAVDRTGLTTATESVTFTTVDGTAKAGINYADVSQTLTFKPSEVEKVVRVPTQSDGVAADPGTFGVVLSNPTGGAILDEGYDHADVHIDDATGRFVLAPDASGSSSVEVQENAGSALFTVDRLVLGLDSNLGTVSVDYATSDGTAKAGADYTATSGTLTFNQGQTSQTFTVPIRSHNLVEGNKTFFVTLSNPTGGATIGGPNLAGRPTDNPAVVTITETPGQVNFSAADYHVAENNASLAVAIVFNPAPEAFNSTNVGQVTVDYSTHDGTARAGTDYTAVSGTLTLGPGSLGQTITIPIVNNSVVDGDRTVLLTLSNATGGASIGPFGTATLTILDEDANRSLDTTPPIISGARTARPMPTAGTTRRSRSPSRPWTPIPGWRA